MVDYPISPISPASSDAGSSYFSDNDDPSSSVNKSHIYKVAMTARARERRMRRMKDMTEEKKEGRTVISPGGNHNVSSPKYTERSLSASRRRSNSNSKKAAALQRAVSPTSKESSTKATPKRNNVSGNNKNVYVHEIPSATPSTPNSSFPTTAFPPSRSAFPSSTPLTSPTGGFVTPGNDSDVTEEELKVAEEVFSDATTPSIMQREEIFHHKAAANIVRLLTPDRMIKGNFAASGGVIEGCAIAINEHSPTDVTASPGLGDPTITSFGNWNEIDKYGFKKVPNKSEVPEDEDEVVHKVLTTRMISPNQQLADLLSQVKRDLKSTPEISRAYATRRKNACGALKVLSAKEENRLKLCWTAGVLDAVSSVLNDVKTTTLDELSSNANTEGRNRMVSVLLNLAANKKNRMLICNTEGVLDSINACIAGDDGESRHGCCMVLLQLAKTSQTRPLIIRCPGLLDNLAKVIEVPKVLPPPPSPLGTPSLRKGYENPYLKVFESTMSPTQRDIKSDPSRSFASPNDTTISPEETLTDSEDESTNRVALSPNDTTMSPEESIYSHEDLDTDTEGDSSYNSSSSSSGAETHGSHTTDHTEEHTEHHTESSGSEEGGENGVEESVGSDEASHGLAKCIVIQSMSEMEICFKTTSDEKQEENDYDADPNRFLHSARLNIFGCLLCLVKSKENAFDVARAEALVKALIDVSKKHNSPSHTRALTILAHLTRHPQNGHHLIFNYLELLPMLQNATESVDADARKYALCSLQNLSIDNSCKTTIAHTDKMIASLTKRCDGDTYEEVHAAIATLQHLADEPANIIQFTIVKKCIGTIMSIARSNKAKMDEGIESKFTQFMAQNTLSKLSFWLRKIATSASQRKDGMLSAREVCTLYDAVLQPTEYEQWK